jgi:hypothetical protein
MSRWKSYGLYAGASLLISLGSVASLAASLGPESTIGPFWGLLCALLSCAVGLAGIVHAARQYQVSPRPLALAVLIISAGLYLAAFGAGVIQQRHAVARVIFLSATILAICAWFLFRISRTIGSMGGIKPTTLQQRWNAMPKELLGPVTKLVIFFAVTLLAEVVVSLPFVPQDQKYKFFLATIVLGCVAVGFLKENTALSILKLGR